MDISKYERDIVFIAKGHPGALKVLRRLLELRDSNFWEALLIKMTVTSSDPGPLCVLYRMTEYDIEKTKLMLTDWIDTSAEPLQEWI